ARLMRIAITGGSGFVGGHTARALLARGDDVVLIARRDHSALIPDSPQVTWLQADIDDEIALGRAVEGCDAVVHCAGINLERGSQTYDRVHVQGTEAVVRASRAVGVKRIALVSFLRARPACGSAYHESKWEAEEIVRRSGLGYTVVKAGVIYGQGDHMLDHLSRAFHTFPVFLLVGFSSRLIRPVAVVDVARILAAAAHDERLAGLTVPVLGPEQLTLSAAVRRVAHVTGRHPLFLRAPTLVHQLLAWLAERLMTIPLISAAQVRILTEGIAQPVLAPDRLPGDLEPITPFSEEAIRNGLPPAERFHCRDLRLFTAAA
ncbi:MAG: NAD(P)H-binding protein, partial [Candidatus Dormibacter sp.]